MVVWVALILEGCSIKKASLTFLEKKYDGRYLFDDDYVGEDFPMKTDESLRLILL